MIPYMLFAFGTAFLVSLVLTYVVREKTSRLGLVDRPDDDRKIHGEPVPVGGGIAILVGTALTIGIAWLLDLPDFREGLEQTRQVAALAAGATGVFVVGIVDDTRGLRAWSKAGAETLLALGLFAAGIRIEDLALGGWSMALPVWVSLILTVGWIVAITNAFNLIDGSDGVAGGAALFALLSFAVVSFLVGKDYAAALSLILAGSTLGFLFFNFPPASIFLGDSGSLLLGFSLASMGVIATQMASTLVAVAVPILAFGVPILDTGLAILRRLLRGEPIFKPDRGHIHHRLMELGHSPRAIAFAVWALSALFGLLSLLLVGETGTTIGTILVAAGAVAVVLVQRLRLPELMELRRMLERGVQQRESIGTNLRLRDAIRRMERIDEGEELLAHLERAFSLSRFARVELWVQGDLADGIAHCAGVRREGDGYFVSIQLRDEADWEDSAWEVRLCLKNGGRTADGRLSIFRCEDDAGSTTTMRLVKREFMPALLGTLKSLDPAKREPLDGESEHRGTQAPAAQTPHKKTRSLKTDD